MTKDFWTIDAETDPFLYGRIPQPFIWGCYNGRTTEYKTFTKTIDLINFMKDKNEIFYAHNGGKFDTKLLLTILLTDYSILSWIEKSGRFIQIVYYNKNGVKISLRDSCCILADKLDNICKDLNTEVKKGSNDIDHNKINNYNDVIIIAYKK